MLTHLWLILFVACFCLLFWQHRKMTERANIAIEQHCQKLALQVLSVSLVKYTCRPPQGSFGLYGVYQFEFSVTGEDYYQGRLLMQGQYPKKFFLPPYRLVDSSDTIIH